MTAHRRLVVYRRADGLYDYRVIAHNGEIVVASAQGFTRRDDAVEAANREFPDLPVEVEEAE